jgi:hypothetical protein
MTPEIKKLQMLNDLIAQTLDVLTQRLATAGTMAPTADMRMGGIGYSGLAHTPFVGGGAQYVDPRFNMAGWNTGLSHTPFVPYSQFTPYGVQNIDPRFTMMGNQVGLTHTPYTAVGAPMINPAINTFGWNSGLTHTPYQFGVDPRFIGVQTIPNYGYTMGW